MDERQRARERSLGNLPTGQVDPVALLDVVQRGSVGKRDVERLLCCLETCEMQEGVRGGGGMST